MMDGILGAGEWIECGFAVCIAWRLQIGFRSRLALVGFYGYLDPGVHG